MISMTYGLGCETNPFVFALFGFGDVRNETADVLVRRDGGDPGQVTQATSIDLARRAAKRASKGAAESEAGGCDRPT
jgi:hypothetical protein